GRNTTVARAAAARKLADFVKHYKFSPGEPLNLVGHSHGGNVDIQAINIGLNHKVDNLITLGTPSLGGYRLDSPGSVRNFIAVSSTHDAVQVLGGRSGFVPLLGETGPAGREQPGAINVMVD